MNLSAIYDVFVSLVFIGWILVLPFQKKRERARWAKLAIVISGLLGITDGVLSLLVDVHWFDRSSLHGIYVMRHVIEGLMLGFMFSLILAGQMLGSKREKDHVA
jgi:type III secretory pathway component EscT